MSANTMMAAALKQCRGRTAIALLVGLFATAMMPASAKSPVPKQKPSDLVTVRGIVANADDKPVYHINGVAELLGADGKPVRDADGQIDRLPEGAYRRWISGKGGEFTVRVRPGTYSVWAEGARRSAVTLVVPKGVSSVPVKILAGLPAEYVRVNGVVVTSDGTPKKNVNGRTMSESGQEGPCWASGVDGKFVIHLTAGTYKLWAVGAKARAVTLVVPKGRTPVSVRVIAKNIGNHLPLRFVTDDGRPVADASMNVGERGSGGWGCGGASTDAKGMMMWIVEGDAPIRLFFAGSGVGYGRLDITDDGMLSSEQPITVQLSTGPYVSGRVLSGPGGVPLGGIPVFPQRKYFAGDPWSGWNTQFGFKSYPYTMKEPSMAISRDGDGVFSLGPLPPGDYTLEIGLPSIWHMFPSTDLIEPQSEDVSLTSGKDLSGLDLRVPVTKPAFSLEGRVLIGDKTPLASQEVTVEVSGDYVVGEEPEEWYVWEPVVRRVVTDDQGGYKLYPLRPGKYKLVAKWHGLSAVAKISVRSDVKCLDFALR